MRRERRAEHVSGPGFPANYLGVINSDTGAITPVSVHGTAVQPKGMLFLP